jgi:hypothetical protein
MNQLGIPDENVTLGGLEPVNGIQMASDLPGHILSGRSVVRRVALEQIDIPAMRSGNHLKQSTAGIQVI